MDKKTTIIVPCYNEQNRLNRQAFEDYLARNRDIVFIFVNDGSRDATGDILKDMCRKYPDHALCIDLLVNVGKAEAVRLGFQRAFSLNPGRIGYWDADLSTPLSVIEEFIEILNNTPAEAVIGSRVRLLGRNIKRQPLRHYLGRIFATFASMVLGIAVYDTQCGAKIYKNSEVLKVVFASPFLSRWIFDVEILARFIKAYGQDGRQKVSELVVEFPLMELIYTRGSKFKLTDVFSVGFQLFRISLFLNSNQKQIR